MKIKPTEGKIQIAIEEVDVGGLDMRGTNVSREYGKIVACGTGVGDYKKGDSIFFKSWAVDIIEHEGKKYYFIDTDSRGLCAKVE